MGVGGTENNSVQFTKRVWAVLMETAKKTFTGTKQNYKKIPIPETRFR